MRSRSKCANPIPYAVWVGFSRSCAATAWAKRSRLRAILASEVMACPQRSARGVLQPVVRPVGREVSRLEGGRAERVRIPAHEHRDRHFRLDAQALLKRA